jgi:hypothetical protein
MTNFFVKSVHCGCTCHRCVEGQQICGELIHFVGGLNPSLLPVRGQSTSHGGVQWTMPNGTQTGRFNSQTNELMFAFGETASECLESFAEEVPEVENFNLVMVS